MANLYKPEDINNAIKILLLENADADMFELIRDLYFKLKKQFDEDFSSEMESSTEEEEEEDDLIMEDISVVKSKDGFYSLT
tara:strand:+ start:34 stop:276 length:243 start_codon:yes stop_codon:yes gene_type:complete